MKMLDIKDIKRRKYYYKQCFAKREYDVDLDEMINLHNKALALKLEQEQLLAIKNKGAKEYEQAKRNNANNLQELQNAMRINTQKVAELTAEYNKVLEEFNNIYLALPNIVVDDAPAGGKAHNEVLREFKVKPNFNFKPKTHIELCKDLKLIDYDRAIKIAGEGNWIYTGMGARLEWAILNFCIN